MQAQGRLDHDSTIARKAKHRRILRFDGQPARLPCVRVAAFSANPCFVALTVPSIEAPLRRRPTSTRKARRSIHRALRSECPRDERVPSARLRPRFRQRTCKREQHRTFSRARSRTCVTHDMDGRRPHECLDASKRFRVASSRSSAPRHSNQRAAGAFRTRKKYAFDFRRQCRNTRLARWLVRRDRAPARRLGSAGVESRFPQSQFVSGPPTREGTAWDRIGERTLSLRRSQSGAGAGLAVGAPCVALPGRRVFEASPVLVERLRLGQLRSREANATSRPLQRRISRGPRASSDRTHRSTSQECLRSHQIRELAPSDASKCERRRVLAQSNWPLQCTERITRRECPRRGSDQ